MEMETEMEMNSRDTDVNSLMRAQTPLWNMVMERWWVVLSLMNGRMKLLSKSLV